MARTALLEPDDNPYRPAAVASRYHREREALMANLLGRRLEVRQVDGRLVTCITPGSPRLAQALALLRGQLPR